MEPWLVLLIVTTFASALAVLILAWRSSRRFAAFQVTVSACVAKLVFQFWFSFSGLPSFLWPIEWFVLEFGGTVIFSVVLLISLALASLDTPKSAAREAAMIATLAGLVVGGIIDSYLFFNFPNRLWKDGIGVPAAITQAMTRAMNEWQQQPMSAPWAGIVPGQQLESFKVFDPRALSGNHLIRKNALSFAPVSPWEFSVSAKYKARRELKLSFYVFAPDKIVWRGVEFTPDTAFAPIPRTQAVLRVWREYPRRAPWGWGLRQMDGLEDTSESLSWGTADSYSPPSLTIKLYDSTVIGWQRRAYAFDPSSQLSQHEFQKRIIPTRSIALVLQTHPASRTGC